MSKPPSDKPPEHRGEETSPPLEPKPERVKPEFFPFGLSADMFAAVTREMLAVARLVCRHSGISPGDAVQQAFVKALSKPETERPSTQDQKKFVAWMCTLARYEALTNRKSHRRRAQREVAPDIDITELVAVPHSLDAVEAREILNRALLALEPRDRELLHALYAEGKTIDDIAREKQLPWTTVDSRRRRLLNLLYATLQATIAALVLLVPKKARAFVLHVTQQAAQFSAVMTVTVVCGALVPTSSSVTTEPSTPLGLTRVRSLSTDTAEAANLQPSFVPEVAPEEPKALDTWTNECSAVDMKSTKIATIVQETLIPFAFLVAPAFAQVACAGSDQQTPPPHHPEEEYDGSPDPYEVMCDQERARGNTCPPREEWLKKIFHQ